MGFFDKLLGRDYKYYLNKSSKAIADNDLNEASECLKHAEELCDRSPSAMQEIDEKRKEIHHKSFEAAIEMAKKYRRSGQREAEENAIERAKRFATDEEKENINKLLEEDIQIPQNEKIDEAHVDGEEKVDGLTTDDKWGLYVTNLPFSRQEHFEKLGKDFKEGWIHLQEGNFEAAVQTLSKVYKEHPDDHLVIFELGHAYYGKGDLQKADELLEKSDSIKPEIDTKLLRVEVLWSMRKFDVAETILQEAHDADPENNIVLARIAQHGLISGDIESGIDAVEVLLENIPNDISVQLLAGRLYVANENDEKALECFETVNHLYWQVNPQTKQISFNHTAALAAADLYVKLDKNLDRAIELYEAVRAHTKGDQHILVNLKLADVFETQKKNSKRVEMLVEATRFMDEILETMSGDKKALMNLQYAQITDMLGNKAATSAKLKEAKSFFQSNEGNNPIFPFYTQLIDKLQNGTPFPKGKELHDQLMAFIKEKAEKQQLASGQRPDLTSHLNDDNDDQNDEEQNDSDVMTINVPIPNEDSPKIDQKASDDLLKQMASMSKPTLVPTESIVDDEKTDEDSSDEPKPSSEEIAKKRAEQNAGFDDIIKRMASLNTLSPIAKSNENTDENVSDEKITDEKVTDEKIED